MYPFPYNVIKRIIPMPRALFIARTASCWWGDDVYTLVSPRSYRQSKFSVVHKEKTNQGLEVTGLALSVVQKSQLLFITTRESLIMYDISVKDKNTPVCTISHQILKHSCMCDIPSGIKHSSVVLCLYSIAIRIKSYWLIDCTVRLRYLFCPLIKSMVLKSMRIQTTEHHRKYFTFWIIDDCFYYFFSCWKRIMVAVQSVQL